MTKYSSLSDPAPTNAGSKWRAIIEITRFDKPIGTFLLLAPTLWGVLLANRGYPPADVLIIFTLGAIIMRAAGCIANDLADRNFDGYVERTRFRPLVTGALSLKEALMLLIILLVLALNLVLRTNPLTLELSVIGVLLAMTYPLMKRVTYFPQAVLGIAFSWSIPMAFSASLNTLPPELWWLFIANVLWTLIYDTQYAMVDREDDMRIGLKSTAILFGNLDIRVIALLQLLCLAAFWRCGLAFGLGLLYFSAVIMVGAIFLLHLFVIKERDPERCFVAFNQSRWIGLIILIGLCTDLWIGSPAAL